MAARRRRNLLSSRRRVEDEEEDGSPVARDDNSDSQSDSSDLSDEDRDAVYAASGVRQSASATMEHLSTKLLEQVFTTPVDGAPDTEVQRSGPTSKPSFPTTADTDVMMNGLKLSDDSQAGDAIEFDEHGSETTTLMETPVNTSTAISRRPKASKEGDSTAPIFQARDRVTESATSAQASVGAPFVPNRGGFFMHDHRNEQHPRAVATARGRGRGRTTLSPRIAGSSGPNSLSSRNGPKWDHDLHEQTLTEPGFVRHYGSARSARLPQTLYHQKRELCQGAISSTVSLGTVLVKICLPGVADCMNSKKIAAKLYTRLPDLRSPLRRDKPVRVLLPGRTARHIFPSMERSFVFVPRASRPNQQGPRPRASASFGRPLGRSASTLGEGRSSVALSRRSSQAREGHISLADEVTTAASGVVLASPPKPVVKLPRVPSQLSTPVQHIDGDEPIHVSSAGRDYPAPSRPTFRENRGDDITLHQPRPQKTVSVADIESPRNAHPYHAPPQQQQQPFHQQVPQHMSQSSMSQDGSNIQYLDRRVSFQDQGLNSTPLSHIGDRAAHAPPFLPSSMTYPMTQPMYYYSQADEPQLPYPSTTNMFLQQAQQDAYPAPAFSLPPPIAETSLASQMGMYAHQSNGMVYYYDSPQFVANAEGPSRGGYLMVPSGDGLVYPPQQPLLYYPAAKS